VDPIPDPLLLRKSGSTGNRTRDLWICSQKLWPLDHRGGLDWLKKTTREKPVRIVRVGYLPKANEDSLLLCQPARWPGRAEETCKNDLTGSGPGFKLDTPWIQANYYYVIQFRSVEQSTVIYEPNRGEVKCPFLYLAAMRLGSRSPELPRNKWYLDPESPHCSKIAIWARGTVTLRTNLWTSLWCTNRLFPLLHPTTTPAGKVQMLVVGSSKAHLCLVLRARDPALH
jgi:hypothetical protein